MIHKLIPFILLILAISLLAACNTGEDVKMFKQSIQKLLEAKSADQEEELLGALLTVAREDYSINYGYRVLNKTKNKRITNDEIHEYLEDELIVTIFVGDTSPYDEYIWHPQNNKLITRLIMP